MVKFIIVLFAIFCIFYNSGLSSDIHNLCSHDCNYRLTALPLYSNSTRWSQSYFYPCDFNCHAQQCESGCSQWQSSNVWFDCAKTVCINPSRSIDGSSEYRACFQGCFAARSRFLRFLQNALESVIIRCSADQQSTYCAANFNKQLRDYESGDHFGLRLQILNQTHWLTLKSDATVKSDQSVTFFENFDEFIKDAQEQIQLRILLSIGPFGLTSPPSTQSVQSYHIATPKLSSLVKTLNDQIIVCWDGHINLTIKLKYRVELSNGENVILAEDINSRCYSFNGLKWNVKYIGHVSLYSTYGLGPSLQIQLESSVPGTGKEGSLLVTNGTHVVRLKNPKDLYVSDPETIFILPRPSADTITTITSISIAGVFVGTSLGKVYHIKETSESVLFVDVSLPIKSIAGDDLNGMIFIATAQFVLHCSTVTCKRSQDNFKMLPTKSGIKNIEVDGWNGFIYWSTPEDIVYRCSIGILSNLSKRFPSFKIVTALDPSMSLDRATSTLLVTSKNGSIISYNYITGKVETLGSKLKTSGDHANRFKMITKFVSGSENELYWISDPCYEESTDINSCLYTTEEVAQTPNQATETILEPRLYLMRDTLSGRLVDIAWEKDAYFSRDFVSSPTNVSFVSGSMSGRLSWSSPRKQPWQADNPLASWTYRAVVKSASGLEIFNDVVSKSHVDLPNLIPTTKYISSIETCIRSICSDPAIADTQTYSKGYNDYLVFVDTSDNVKQVSAYDSTQEVPENAETYFGSLKEALTKLVNIKINSIAFDELNERLFYSELDQLWVYQYNDRLAVPISLATIPQLNFITLVSSENKLVLATQYNLLIYSSTGNFEKVLLECTRNLKCHEIWGLYFDSLTSNVFYLTSTGNQVQFWKFDVHLNEQELVSSTSSLPRISQFIILESKLVFTTEDGRIAITDQNFNSTPVFLKTDTRVKLLLQQASDETGVKVKSVGFQPIDKMNIIDYKTTKLLTFHHAKSAEAHLLYNVTVFDANEPNKLIMHVFTVEQEVDIGKLNNVTDINVQINALTTQKMKRFTQNKLKSYAALLDPPTDVVLKYDKSTSQIILQWKPIYANDIQGHKIFCRQAPNSSIVWGRLILTGINTYTLPPLNTNGKITCSLMSIPFNGADGKIGQPVEMFPPDDGCFLSHSVTFEDINLEVSKTLDSAVVRIGKANYPSVCKLYQLNMTYSAYLKPTSFSEASNKNHEFSCAKECQSRTKSSTDPSILFSFDSLRAKTEYVLWVSRKPASSPDTPERSMSPALVFRTDYVNPNAAQKLKAFALSPNRVRLYWKLPTNVQEGYAHTFHVNQETSAELDSDIPGVKIIHPEGAPISSSTVTCSQNPCVADVKDLLADKEYKFTVVSNPKLVHESPAFTSTEIQTLGLPGFLYAISKTSESIHLKWVPASKWFIPDGTQEIVIQYREEDSAYQPNKTLKTMERQDIVKEAAINATSLESMRYYSFHYTVLYRWVLAYDNTSYVVDNQFTQEMAENPVRTKGIPPTKPAFISMEKDDNGWIINWNEPEFNGGEPVVGYVIEYRTNSNKNWQPLHSNWGKHYLRPSELDLVVNDQFQFRVQAVNQEGRGSWAEIGVKQITGPAGLSKAAVIGILVAGSGVLAIAIICCVVIYCVCRRKAAEKGKHAVFKVPANPAITNSVFCEDDDASRQSHIEAMRQIPDEEIKSLPHVPRSCITIAKMLGKGAFGEVYEGLACNLPKIGPKTERVAIKTLRPSSRDEEKVKFLKEAIMMENFDHKNIVKLLGVCLDSEPHWIIIELMEGGDLLSYLRSCRPHECMPSQVTMQDLVSILIDISSGCAYLESQHHVHRDLAARNCLITSRNPQLRVVKIADFGLARDVYEDDYYRLEGQGLLPVRWMAPESTVDGVFTLKTDVWSFGVLMWEVMTLGQQPYQGRGNWDVMNYVRIGGRLQKPEFCPEEMYEIMAECWAFTSTERPDFSDITLKLEALSRLPSLNENTPFPPVSMTGSDIRSPETSAGSILFPQIYGSTAGSSIADDGVHIFTTHNSAAFHRGGVDADSSARSSRNLGDSIERRGKQMFRSLTKKKPKEPPPAPPSRAELEIKTGPAAPHHLRPESGISSGAESFTTSTEGYEVPLIKNLSRSAQGYPRSTGEVNPSYDVSPTSIDQIYMQKGRPTHQDQSEKTGPEHNRFEMDGPRYVPSPRGSSRGSSRPTSFRGTPGGTPPNRRRVKKDAPPPIPLDESLRPQSTTFSTGSSTAGLMPMSSAGSSAEGEIGYENGAFDKSPCTATAV